MHLTFVNSEGLEQSALSIIASSSSEETLTCKKMMELVTKYFTNGGGVEDPESDSEFFVIDENSPLLLDLDPPGTIRSSYMGEDWGRKPKKSLLMFKIRKENYQRLPWVIVLTALGMAAMVLIGFITMLLPHTASITNFTDNDSLNVINVTEAPSSTDPPIDQIPNDSGNGSLSADSILNNSSSPRPELVVS